MTEAKYNVIVNADHLLIVQQIPRTANVTAMQLQQLHDLVAEAVHILTENVKMVLG